MRGDRIADGIAAGLAAAGCVLIAVGHSPYLGQVVVWTALNVALAASLRLMLLVGEVNLAVGAFFGIGAYGAAVLYLRLGVPMLPSIAAGGVLAGLASLPFGALTLRTTGHYFMLVSFALTEILRLVYSRSSLLGGNSGLVGIVPDVPGFGYVALLIATGVFVALVAAERSHLGRLFRAVAESPAMVGAVGISAARVKLICLLLSSMAAGTLGGTLAFANTVIAPGDFGFLLPVFALAYVKVEGDAHPVGQLLGAVILSALAQLAIGFGAQDTLLYGAAIVLTMLFMPGGVVGLVSNLAARRRALAGRPVAEEPAA